MKMELTPPPPPATPSPNHLGISTTAATNTTSIGSGSGGGGGGGIIPPTSTPSVLDQQKENQKNQYAERVKNSPGWRRRYGVESTGNSNSINSHYYAKRNNHSHPPPPPPPQPVPKVRLPLPKNAVLLSLIQASEPARRRAEVEAPSTPQKAQQEDENNNHLTSPPRLSGSNNNNPSSLVLVGSGSGGGGISSATSLPQFSRPSPLFLDKSNSSDHDPTLGGIDNSADDEEHKIRVGTYLEGGPCGTYAVAVKSGLLVYPTLFEHTLPSALSGLRGRGGNGSGGGGGGSIAGGSLEEEEIDVMKRDVEQVVKNYYREGVMKNEKRVEEEAAAAAAAKKMKRQNKKKATKSDINNALGSSAEPNSNSSSSSNNNLATWVECHDDENVETHCQLELLDNTILPQHEVVAEADEEDEGDTEEEDDTDGESSDHFASMSDPGVVGPAMGRSLTDSKNVAAVTLKSIYRGRAEKAAGAESEAAGNSETTAELSFSLTISEDEHDKDEHDTGNDNDDECSSTECDIGVTTSTIRRSHSAASATASQSSTPIRSNDTAVSGGKKYVRHFSVGAYPAQTSQAEMRSTTGENDGNDDFERPLIRLKYGDRVQVVSMDSRGWVKLARGYGYIRLENAKQLVKGNCFAVDVMELFDFVSFFFIF